MRTRSVVAPFGAMPAPRVPAALGAIRTAPRVTALAAFAGVRGATFASRAPAAFNAFDAFHAVNGAPAAAATAAVILPRASSPAIAATPRHDVGGGPRRQDVGGGPLRQNVGGGPEGTVQGRLDAATTLEEVRALAQHAMPGAGAQPSPAASAIVVQCLRAAGRVTPGAPAFAFGLALTGVNGDAADPAPGPWPAPVVAELLRMATDNADYAAVTRLFAYAHTHNVCTAVVYRAAMRALQRHRGAADTDADEAAVLGLALAQHPLPLAWQALDTALGDAPPPPPPPAAAVAEALALWSEMEARGVRAGASTLGHLMTLCARHQDSVSALKAFLVARDRATEHDPVRSFVRPKQLDWDVRFVHRLVAHLERDDPGLDGRHRVVTFLLSWVFTQPSDLEHVWQLYSYVLGQYAHADVDRPPWKRSYRLMHHSVLHWLLSNGHTHEAVAVVYGLLNRPLPDGYARPDLAALLHAQRLTATAPAPAVLLPNLLWTRLLKSVGQARGTLPVVCDLVCALVGSNAGAVNVLVYNACLSALKAQAAVVVGLGLARGTPTPPATDRALWSAVTATMRALQVGLPLGDARTRALVADVVREIQIGRDERTTPMVPAVQLAWSLLGLLLACGHAPSAGSVNSAAEVALVFDDTTSAYRVLQLAARLGVRRTEHTVRVAQRARQAAVAAGDLALAAQLRQCERAAALDAATSAGTTAGPVGGADGPAAAAAAGRVASWTRTVAAAAVYEGSAWTARLARWFDALGARPGGFAWA